MAENTNAPTGNVSVVQNTNAANAPAAQNANAPTPAKNVSVAQSGNAPAPRSDCLAEVRKPATLDSSSKPLRDPPGCPTQEGSLVAQPLNQLSRRATKLRLAAGSWLSQLVYSTSIRFVMFFCTGVAVTLAWQSYGDAGKDAITTWCGRWTPQVASAAQKGSSPEELVPPTADLLNTTSLNLTAVRESIDKLAAELSRLQTVEKLAAELTRLQLVATPNRTSVPSPLVSPIPPAAKPSSPSRPPPAH